MDSPNRAKMLFSVLTCFGGVATSVFTIKILPSTPTSICLLLVPFSHLSLLVLPALPKASPPHLLPPVHLWTGRAVMSSTPRQKVRLPCFYSHPVCPTEGCHFIPVTRDSSPPLVSSSWCSECPQQVCGEGGPRACDYRSSAALLNVETS